MGRWNRDTSKAPVATDFEYRGSIDYAAYNQAVNEWNQKQEQARYDQGLNLMSEVMKMFGNDGAYEQSYRNAKNRYMAQSASDLVSRGMGNLVNAPALGLAYDREVRPEFEMQRQNRLASAMTSMAGYMANYTPQFPVQGTSFSRTINFPQSSDGGGSSSSAGRVASGPSTLDSPFARVSFL